MTNGAESITVRLEEPPDPADVRAIGEGLTAFNHAMGGDDNYRPFVVALRDGAGRLVGGLYGATYWDWLQIDLLWIEERYRGQGFGSRLLAEAESEAIRRGCRRAHLDTMSFQAPGFYLKRGYVVFGELPDLPPGGRLIYLVKDLTAGDNDL
jgi:GNAT superfamily N-acetyltransferase